MRRSTSRLATPEAARLALLYYDKTYQHGLDKRDWSKAVDGRGLGHDERRPVAHLP